MRFKELETSVRRAKASLLQKGISEKKKELDGIEKTIAENTSQKESIKTKVAAVYSEVEGLNQQIQEINYSLQFPAGLLYQWQCNQKKMLQK